MIENFLKKKLIIISRRTNFNNLYYNLPSEFKENIDIRYNVVICRRLFKIKGISVLDVFYQNSCVILFGFK